MKLINMIKNVEHLLGLFGLLWSTKSVYGRFCEGGHICSLPRECCTQGCCPPYQNGPRQLPPATDHVLNLFFISHWYFWCVVVAIILAILCAYSLWKKRRTVCGWGLTDHHAQSEGDSAGSCYAPPQYSRCNSFHHPPPPYTEVTSKPDLYPLVFTCNSDNGKNGASYLMVQYFRNYIVRPAGSLSATSTVDSLSSSFICNANEANTLVPPPYSRATSPDVGGFNSQFQQHFIPRSASQLVCANGIRDSLNRNIASQEAYQSRNNQYNSPGSAAGGAQGPMDIMSNSYNNTQRGQANADGDSITTFSNEPPRQDDEGVGAVESARDNGMTHQSGGFVQSHSEQYFRYVGNSGNSSISDIFVNKSCCTVELNDRMSGTGATGYSEQLTSPGQQIASRAGTPAIYSKGCIQTNPLVHRVVSNPKQITEISTNAVYNSNSSIGGISITVPAADGGNEDRDLNVLRRSLETCCQFLQQQQIQPMTSNFTHGDSPSRMNDFSKKYGNEGLRSYVTSGTCSAVSSLANIGTPSSPPQATSPTGEIRDILDQIRQLHAAGETNVEGNLATNRAISQSPIAVSPHSRTSIGEPFTKDTQSNNLTRQSAMPEKHGAITNASPTNGKRSTHNTSASGPSTSIISNTQLLIAKRPSTLHQNKKKFFTPKPNKSLYVPIVPITSSSTNRFPLKSPVSSVVGPNFFANRSRVRKGWISRSAPSTPATGMPPNHLGDDSPLLNEHDEEQETEHENLE